MTSLSKKLLPLGLATLALFSGVSARANANLGFHKAMSELAQTAAISNDSDVKLSASFSVTKVKGNNVEDMLEDYARRTKYDMQALRIVLDLKSSEIPSSDDGSNLIGLGRNVDLVGLAIDLFDNLGSSASDKAIYDVARAKALKALFEITQSGAKVGVESAGWNACGVTFPALIILDVANKTVYSLTPDDVQC
jgi:hypothetical protein